MLNFSGLGALAVEAAGKPYETEGFFLDNVWIIPLIPAVSFAIIILFGKKLPKKGSEVGLLSIAAVLALSVLTAVQWAGERDGPSGPQAELVPAAAYEGDDDHSDDGDHSDDEDHSDEGDHSDDEDHADDGEAGAVPGATGPGDGESATGDVVEVAVDAEGGDSKSAWPAVNDAEWFKASDDLTVTVGTMVDGLTVMMLLTVGLVSSLVHLYSLEYLKGDRRYTHYYAFLSLFTAAMLLYVVSSSLLQMLVAWELVGLCSFTLIGHWWEEKENTDAAMKAFLTNRVGDIGLLVGVTIIILTTGTTDVLSINQIALGGTEIEVSHLVWLVAACCLMGAVASKSGQFPLHTWLPDAMAGPTPVSALIHAATMVVAGVFLIARMYPVFWEGFSIATSSINLMAVMGGFTTVMAGALAFVQRDVKKVLAYSTVSQLGYMVMALGVGAWTAGTFHLFTHAFFKACLFLGAGSLSHACHHSFDMKSEMGGLRKVMPTTFKTFVIGSLALAGIPPLAGFWSKDELLAGAAVGQGSSYPIIFVMGCITAFLTAAYMTRVIWLVFMGEYRGHSDPHESPKVMTIPLWILAGLALVAGLFNIPKNSIFSWVPDSLSIRFEHFVEPNTYGVAFPAVSHSGFVPWVAVLSIFLAVAGIAVTSMYYRKCVALGVTELPNGLTTRFAPARAGYKFLENKYYLDHLYTDIIAGGTKGVIARATNWFNSNVLDGIINTVGTGSVKTGQGLYKYVDQGIVDNVVTGSGTASSGAGGILRRMQTGKVQQYGALLFAGVAVLAAVFMIVI